MGRRTPNHDTCAHDPASKRLGVRRRERGLWPDVAGGKNQECCSAASAAWQRPVARRGVAYSDAGHATAPQT